MPPKPLDFEAARAELRGKIATNEAALASASDRLGALALDVTLGNAAQSELDAANAEHARLASNAEALQAALAEVDRREAAQQEKDAAAEHARLERELVAAEAQLDKSTAAAVAALDTFAEHVAAVATAEREAVALSARLGRPRSYLQRHDLAQATLSRLSPHMAPALPLQPPNAGKDAERRLQAVS